MSNRMKFSKGLRRHSNQPLESTGTHQLFSAASLHSLPATQGQRWADQGLNIDVPAIPAGLAAFTQSQDV